MKTITTLVEALKITAMGVGAIIGTANKGMDKVKESSRLCNAATKESFKDLLSSNAECTQELSKIIVEYPISLLTSDSKTKQTKAEDDLSDVDFTVTPNKTKVEEVKKDESTFNN